MARQSRHLECEDLHRKSREEIRKQETTLSLKEIATSLLVPSFLRSSRNSPSKFRTSKDFDKLDPYHRRSRSRHQTREEVSRQSLDIETPFGSSTTRRRQTVSGHHNLHNGFGEISSGGIGVMVNLFERSSHMDQRTKGPRRGVSVTLEGDLSYDDGESDNESWESNKANVGSKTVIRESQNTRRSHAATRVRQRTHTSILSPLIPQTVPAEKTISVTRSRPATSHATSTTSKDSEKSRNRSSQPSGRLSRQSSTRGKQPNIENRQSTIHSKHSSTKREQKDAPSKKENNPPGVEIPPRYHTKLHVCYCCSKTRSKEYQLDHPIGAKVGAKPSLCGPCGYTIFVSGKLPRPLEHKRAYLSGLHWCATCGTLRSTRFHLDRQNSGPNGNPSNICVVYETKPDRGNKLISKCVQDVSPSVTTLDPRESPDHNYPDNASEVLVDGRPPRQALRSILINASSHHSYHSATGPPALSRGVSDSSSNNRAHFTNPEISGLTTAPDYDRSPIELDYPEEASHPSPMIPSARKVQAAAASAEDLRESSSTRDSEYRGASQSNVATAQGAPASSSWNNQSSTAWCDVSHRNHDICVHVSHHGDPPQNVKHPQSSNTHHPELGYRAGPDHDKLHPNDRRHRSTSAKVHQKSTTDYSAFPSQAPQPQEGIKPFSGYNPNDSDSESGEIKPLSGYFPPSVVDYFPTPGLLDEPINHPYQQQDPPNSSSTDTLGRPAPRATPRSPSVTPDPAAQENRGSARVNTSRPYQQRFPNERCSTDTFGIPIPSHAAGHQSPSEEPGTSRSSYRGGTAFCAPSPVFSEYESATGQSTRSGSDGVPHHNAFTSDARRRAESEARLFAAAAGYVGGEMPVVDVVGVEEGEMRGGGGVLPEAEVWEVSSVEAGRLEAEHEARVSGGSGSENLNKSSRV